MLAVSRLLNYKGDTEAGTQRFPILNEKDDHPRREKGVAHYRLARERIK